jgi:CheY-like chemotaxis protein
MTTPPSILLVDDDPAMLALVREAIGDDYPCHGCADGPAALAEFERLRPGLVLLDISLPGMDGYEVCRRLREAAGQDEIMVLFISGHDDMDHRLAAYDAGGDDFTAKPFAIPELRRKLAVAMRTRAEMAHRRHNLDEIRNVAFTALSSSGELGAVLRFFQASNGCANVEELARALVAAVAEYGVRAVVQMRFLDRILTLNSDGRQSPMEHELLLRMARDERLSDFGSRTLVNYPHVTLLVRDLPMDDPDRVGRLRDHVCMLAEAAEMGLKRLSDLVRLSLQHEALRHAADGIAEVIAEIEGTFKRQQSELVAVFGNLDEEMTRLFSHLELQGNQEVALTTAVDGATRHAQQVYEEGMAIDRRLGKVLADLMAVIGKRAE